MRLKAVLKMRNALKFFAMLPMVIGSMFIGALLVGFSVAVDSLETIGKSKDLPTK